MRAQGQVLKRQNRTRAKIRGTRDMPRVSVFRSNRYFFAQIIDDEKNLTIASVSERSLNGNIKGTKIEKAKQLGLKLASLAKKKKLSKAVFDRGRYAYHGRVKAFAQGLAEGGLRV